jgi:hypothetical protein
MTQETKKPILYLHIGHGKTGSSYLQTCLGSSLEILRSNGISYPINDIELNRARSGQTTEGNFPPVSLKDGHSIEAFNALLANISVDLPPNVLISNEGLFQSFLLHDFLSKIYQNAPEYEIRVLLFIRDPFEHLISAFQELLKADVVNEIEDLFERSSVPSNVSALLDILEKLGAKTTVVNFSRHRNDLKQVTEHWLGLPAGALASGPEAKVNRSMDRSEILVQQAFNKYLGNFARRFVSDALARELPNLKPTKPFIAYPVLESFIKRMEFDILKVNNRIPQSEHYQVPTIDEAKAQLPSEKDAKKIELTVEQLDVLARNISRFFPPERQKKT